jgi:7,8-dihydropterin-6-yl-methyl-4-(beta-D-ribofuranosyl)aminobenzene 5'-phosphate synthase
MKSTFWPKFWIAALAGLMVCSLAGATSPSSDSITVVYNHIQGKSKTEHQAKGGLSTYVKFKGKVILFDTGGEANPLVQNLDELGLDATLIDAIVLSHDHWDHVSGLPGVLSATAMEPKVYVPAPAAEEILQQNPQANVVAVSKPTGILPDAWLVGPMQLEYSGETIVEQALVLDQKDGLVVIVGCSHPGIVSVVEQVKQVFGYRKIKLVVGGLHLRAISKNEIKDISLRLQQMGVRNLALSHCTGGHALKIFRHEWGDRVVSFDLGDSIDF